MPELQIGLRDFFRTRCTSFHFHSSLLTFMFCVFVYLILSVSMRKCVGKHSCVSSTFPVTRNSFIVLRSSDHYGTVGPSYRQAVGTSFFLPAVLLSIFTLIFSPSSFLSMSYYIFAVLMRKCFEKHSSMSSPFTIAILNGTSPISSAKTSIRSGSRVLLNKTLNYFTFFLCFYLISCFLFPCASGTCSVRSAKTAIRSVSLVPMD